MLEYRDRQSTLLAIALGAATVAYLGWKVSESPEQALQFAFNGASVGAVYALLAMGFTLVYSTVWFFDLYYGAAAAIGAYGVFYLRSQETLGGQYEVNHPFLNVAFGVVATGVLWWALHARYHRGLSRRYGARAVTVASGVLSAAVGVYTAVLLTFPARLEVLLSPVLGVAVALAVVWAVRRGYRGTLGAMAPMPWSPPRPSSGRRPAATSRSSLPTRPARGSTWAGPCRACSRARSGSRYTAGSTSTCWSGRDRR